MTIKASPNSTGWASVTRISVTLPSAAPNLVHGLHGLDDEDRLAFLHSLADFHEGASAGSGREIGRANHRRGDRVLRVAGSNCRSRGLSRSGSSGCDRSGRCNAVSRHMHGRRSSARNADAQGILFDFDFGEVGFFQDVREVANEGLIDAGLLLCHENRPVLILLWSNSSESGSRLRVRNCVNTLSALHGRARHRRCASRAASGFFYSLDFRQMEAIAWCGDDDGE